MKNDRAFTPSDKKYSRVNTLLVKKYLSGSTPFNKKYLTGFTLIELLVSSTIIVLMLLVAAPAYDQVQSRNELKAGALKIQNCILAAKAQSLGPATNDVNITTYQSVFTHLTNGWSCQVITHSQTYDTVTDTINLPVQMGISLNSPFLFEFLPGARGQTVAGSNNQFYLFDRKNRCLNLNFDYAVGELRLKDPGLVVNNACS